MGTGQFGKYKKWYLVVWYDLGLGLLFFARRYTAINIWTGKLEFELNLQIDDFNTEGVLVGQRLIGSSFGGELFLDGRFASPREISHFPMVFKLNSKSHLSAVGYLLKCPLSYIESKRMSSLPRSPRWQNPKPLRWPLVTSAATPCLHLVNQPHMVPAVSLPILSHSHFHIGWASKWN